MEGVFQEIFRAAALRQKKFTITIAQKCLMHLPFRSKASKNGRGTFDDDDDDNMP